MGIRAVFAVIAGLILLTVILFCNRAQAEDLPSVSREAVQAYNASDYAKALEKGRQALELAEKSGNKQATAIIVYFLGGVCWQTSQYEKALGYYERALAISKEIGNRDGIGAALTGLGTVYQELGQYDKALSTHEEALALKKEAGDRQGAAAELAEIGIVYSYLGRYEKALGYFDQALAIHKEADARQDIAGDLAEIGIVYSYLGRYEKALGYFDQALAIHKETDARQDVAGDLAEVGIVYSYLGQYQKALEYFEQALTIHREIGARKDVAGDLGEVGIICSQFGQHEKALKYYEEASGIQQEIGDRNGYGRSLASIGTVYWNLGQYDKALGYFDQALAIGKQIGDQESVAMNLSEIGSAYSHLGQYDKAHGSIKESLRIGIELGAPEILWRGLYQMGRASAGLGKDLEAVSHYEKAIETIEAMRTGLSEKETKITFMMEKIFVYDELIELYQKMHAKEPSKGYDEKALEIFERKQGRVFLEEMGKSGTRDFAGLPGAVKDSETDLENRMEKATGMIAAERSKSSSQQDATLIQALKSDLEKIRVAYHALREEIRTKYPDYYALKFPEPAGLKDIQEKTLGPDECLLVYAVLKESVCLWVIGKKHFGLYPIKIGENELGKKVSSYRISARAIVRDLGIGDKIEAGSMAVSLKGRELYELLLPKEAIPGNGTLYIVPSGPLYGLPFEALVSRMEGEKPRYLVEDYPIAYLSSASLLKTLRETRARKETKPRFPLLAFANPVYGQTQAHGATRGESPIEELRSSAYLDLMGGSFLELPETEEEAREIKTILQASEKSLPLQLRQDASRSNVLKLNESQKLTDYQYVVFSCHGVVPEVTNRVTQPALVLSRPDPAGGDGFLTMADTFGLRLNADLVTLSACNTAMGIEIRGEGVMGLTRAFMYAGTSAVSVTLWPVESISAMRMSTGLYENLHAGKGRAAALRDIKLRLIQGEEDEMYRYPFFWAPVVLFGDGR